MSAPRGTWRPPGAAGAELREVPKSPEPPDGEEELQPLLETVPVLEVELDRPGAAATTGSTAPLSSFVPATTLLTWWPVYLQSHPCTAHQSGLCLW